MTKTKAHVSGHTGKRRYRDRVSALLALATAQRKDNPRRPHVEQRAYRCPACKGWHLTHQETR